jgi:hypothetical protein
MKEFRYPAGDALGSAICETALSLAIEPMRNVARERGYILAVHGSMKRDIDLVAVPWRENANGPEMLLADLKGAVMGVFGRARLDPKDEWTEKPHGRRAKSIHVYCEGHFFYFDISVMPLAPKPEEEPA